MKRSTTLILVLIYLSTSAQQRLGLVNDNYAGSEQIGSNPANAVDSRFQFHMHVVGGGIHAQNNYLGLKMPYSPYRLINNNLPPQYTTPSGNPVFKNSYINERLNGNDKFAFADARISTFKSIFNFGDKFALHLGFAQRVHLSITNINEDALKTFLEDLGQDKSSKINQERLMNKTMLGKNMGLAALAYSQFTFGFAGILQENKKQFIKYGLSIHRNTGLYGSYFKAKDFRYTLTGFDTIVVHDADMEFATINETYYNNQDRRLNDFFGKSKLGGGWGLDLGLVYENRPATEIYSYKIGKKRYVDRSENKYDWKVSAALLDLGYIRFNNSLYTFKQTVNPLKDGNIAFNDFTQTSKWKGTEELDSFLKDFFPAGSAKSEFTMFSPARLLLSFDKKIQEKFYLSANYQQSLQGNKAKGARAPSLLSIVPRFEKKWLTIATPVSFGKMYSKVNVGLYARVGIIYLGTDNFGSFVIPKKSGGSSIYAGINWPIHFQKIKDVDADGVPDNEDECPEMAGSLRTKGCPDSDEDGIIDSEDECPLVPGKKAFNGCPDTDGDGVPDNIDKCPLDYGNKKTEGCPDRDGDGLADIFDKCPDEVGLLANNGCPETKSNINLEENQSIEELVKKPNIDQLDTSKNYSFFNFDEYDYWPVLGAYNDPRWADELKTRLNSNFNINCTVKSIPGESKYYVTIGSVTNTDEAKRIEDIMNRPEVNQELNGKLWWKKIKKN